MREVYSIGYTPKGGLHEPGYRKIKLKGPRMDVKTNQARDGYYAGKEPAKSSGGEQYR